MRCLRDLINRIEREKGEILILSHESPDGDSMGSGLALFLFLRKKGKKAVFLSKDGVPYVYDFLPGANKVLTSYSGHASLAILVDASKIDRVGIEPPYPFDELVRIDHHPVGDTYSPYDILDSSAPSTGNLIFNLLKEWDYGSITPEIATCLYTALLTDTGSFRYSNATRQAFLDAAELVELGADPAFISRMVYMRKRREGYALLVKVLSRLETAFDGLVAIITIHSRDFAETGALREEANGFTVYPLSLDGVEVGIKLEEDGDREWYISFRGKGKINLSQVALELGGGGHFNASGARMEGTEEEVKSRILEVLARHMKEAGLLKKNW